MTRDENFDRERAIENYRRIVQVPSVSDAGWGETDWSVFAEMHSVIDERYPLVVRHLRPKVILEHSLLFTWKGQSDQEPIVLMAHLDVVSAGDQRLWTRPPFAADIVEMNGGPTVIGRGAIDDKASLVQILEAIEQLLQEGFTPSRDVYLSSAHNEEVGGDATPTIVRHLKSLGVVPKMVLDEGGIVGDSIFGPVEKDIVFVGIAEKGTAAVRISANEPGGFTAVAPRNTSITRIAKAIVAVTSATAPTSLHPVTKDMIRAVGPFAPGAFARAAELLGTDEADAIDEFSTLSRDAYAAVHSYPSFTVVDAGHSVISVPETAAAYIDVNIGSDHRVQQLVDWLRKTIDDPAVTIELLASNEPSAFAPSSGWQWDALVKSIKQTFGDDRLVLPYINNGMTDSHNFSEISDTVYRFSPVEMTLDERDSLDAVNEHLRVSSFTNGIRFYRSLLQEL